MAPSKRQIIKTKPQRPYIIARVVLLVLAVVALVLGALFFTHPHGLHAIGGRAQRTCSSVLQEAFLVGRTAPILASLERHAHEVLH
jgi:hypothetical protein